jgi:glycerol-3-phosphate dehydrogenase
MSQLQCWNSDWRERTWDALDEDEWDVAVVGGGITGAGILREAARLKLRALLVEQRDFAWGTSSRSSKLVHGGLRYLKSGQIGLTRASVQGREQLLAQGPGLIDPLGFLLAQYKDDSAGRLLYGAGLTIYDLMALQWSHRYYSPQDFQMLAPYISPTGLRGGFQYMDAQTDDARLVLRILREASGDGGVALNYVRAEELVHDDNALVGIQVSDLLAQRTKTIRARVIINATGAWADTLRVQVGAERRIRPLRGSHLIFPAWRFPVAQAVSFMHPFDGRPVFAFPWEGVTLLGTTDVDCPPPLEHDPCITAEEVAYLMAAVAAHFPTLDLSLDDVLATFAGIRPVIGSGKVDPSDESRDHVIWQENGLLTVTGGKLTTFRQVAREALEQVCGRLYGGDAELAKSQQALLHEDVPVLNPVNLEFPAEAALPEETQRRLLGRYGIDALDLVAAAGPDELILIPGAVVLWAELRWAARAEAVAHLDDLLLRRARLGLLLPRGGAEQLPRIRAIVQPELGWEDARWESEEAAYKALIATAYSLPPRETIPDWRAELAQARADKVALESAQHERWLTWCRRAIWGLLVTALLTFVIWLWSRRRGPGEGNG